MTVSQIFLKLKLSKCIQNFRPLNIFGKFLLIVKHNLNPLDLQIFLRLCKKIILFSFLESPRQFSWLYVIVTLSVLTWYSIESDNFVNIVFHWFVHVLTTDTVQCRSYSKKTVNRLYNYSTLLTLKSGINIHVRFFFEGFSRGYVLIKWGYGYWFLIFKNFLENF